MIKLLYKMSAAIFIISLLLPVQSIFAHTLTTAGVPVPHFHFGKCIPPGYNISGCPMPDSQFEASKGFKASDRIYSSTAQWNCHGRTFDNKQSWVNTIAPYINYNGPYCVAKPGYGNAVIFFQGNEATHSATIVGPWKGLNTLIMSKYGKQGQYKHALVNSANVYGGNWTVAGFTGPVKIYTASNDTKNIDGVPFMNNISAFRIQSLLRSRETMPWYKDVLESKKIYEIEHPKEVAKSANMNQTRLNVLNSTTDILKKIPILIEDLKDEWHYISLAAYDKPSYAPEFIEEIEAGKRLVSLVKENPGLKEQVVKQLRDILANESNENHKGYLDGAVVHFLKQMLSQTEKDALKKELGTTSITPEFPTYRDFYLNRM